MTAYQETSRLAYRQHVGEGRASTQAEAIKRFLSSHGESTIAEVAMALGMDKSSASGRINDGIKSGLFRPMPKRPCEVTGRLARPVSIQPEQGSLL